MEEDGEEEESEPVPIPKAASIAVYASLTALLANQGLKAPAIMTLKSGLHSIVTAVKYWLPYPIRLALITLGIVGITAVVLAYWKQISMVFEAIVDIFVSAAKEFADGIRKAFDSISSTARESDADNTLTVDGKQYKVKGVTKAVAKSISDEYGDKRYHRAFILKMPQGNLDGTYVYIDLNAIDLNQAVNIITSVDEPFLHNIYTYRKYRARKLMNTEFPGAILVEDINKEAHGETDYQYVLPHFHAYVGGDKLGNHSFYGLPVKVTKRN